MSMKKKPLSFVVVGSVWRAMFYARIARRNPEYFRLEYMLCRSQEKAERLRRELGIPTAVSEGQCEEAGPDFVVVAVSKDGIFQVTREWAVKGFPVLCETPAGMSEEELRKLWELKKGGARIQVAEQYHRYPILMAGLDAVCRGAVGDPYAVRLSAAHDYHGASLIRRMLRIAPEPVEMRGKRYVFPVRETDSRYGAVRDGSVKERERACVTMEFASGKMAYYDFSGVQYHSFIRSRHVNVQGQDGEWNDTILRYVGEGAAPVEEKLLYRLPGEYGSLETGELAERARLWSPVLELDSAQDEYAIASMLLDMGDYLESGREVYPLAEALEDAYMWLLMEQAMKAPGTVVRSEAMPWRS